MTVACATSATTVSTVVTSYGSDKTDEHQYLRVQAPGRVAIRSRLTTASEASDFGQGPGAQPWVTPVAAAFSVLARVGAPSAQKITPVTMKTASGTASVSR